MEITVLYLKISRHQFHDWNSLGYFWNFSWLPLTSSCQ